MKDITLEIDNSEFLKLLLESIGNSHALSVTKNARVIKNRDNEVIGIVEIVTDLTALKNARLKMEYSNAALIYAIYTHNASLQFFSSVAIGVMVNIKQFRCLAFIAISYLECPIHIKLFKIPHYFGKINSFRSNGRKYNFAAFLLQCLVVFVKTHIQRH